MTLNDILKSKLGSQYVPSLLAETESITFPYPTSRRDVILRRLEELNIETHDAIEIFICSPHGMLFDRRHLSDRELYMLRERVKCAIDFLSRLSDALPSQQWFSTGGADLETEDTFLYSGIWREFGQQWMASLAWRLARGHES